MTRTAFRATLEITDHDPSSPLTSVGAQVQITDGAGNVANSRFRIEAPTLDSIDRVDGNGTIAASTTATIIWLLIPSDEAAPTAATDYFVAGQFSYDQGGVQAQVPLDPVKITVHPDAALDLIYFHQRDVFGDDPFTPQIEPSIPYALAVMVKNRGAGAANNLTISSGQPQIVSNLKGLVIDFKLVGAMLDGTNAANSLSLNFGQVAPGSISIAEWFFTSSLQGFFRDFSATFQHQDDLGNIHLSTIKSVSIHELTHIVDAGFGFSDGRSDFLVNDVPDPNNLPDTLYLSNGTTNTVQAVQQFAFDSLPSASNLQVQLTVPAPGGWVYFRVPEPSGGQLALAAVTRSDGVPIELGTNVWTTDRVFPGPGVPAITTNLLHIFDYDSPGGYTLFYSTNASAPIDTTPPASLMAPLPVQSPQQFPVTWSGQDNDGGSGLAYFDIFVSANNGPFVPWLQHTTLRGAIYSGNLGSNYSFYSVATDNAGNREATHGSPDATTAVTLTHHPPVLAAIPNQTINEGTTFSLTATASNPDAGAVLTFSLGPGAPPGMTLGPATGRLTWATGEADGPGTNAITVIVTDNGMPSMSATQTFTLVVNEVNTPPVLPVIANQTVSAGSQMVVANTATDSDIPANPLSYQLVNSPAGAVIDSNGIITWTPTRAQAPSTNLITTVVTDSNPWAVNAQHMSATNSFVVVVIVTELRPVITNQPANLVLVAGGTASFGVGASGTAPFAYQWQFNSNNIANATKPTLALTNLLIENAGQYAVLVTNAYGSALSSNAQLTVSLVPVTLGAEQDNHASVSVAKLLEDNQVHALYPLTLASMDTTSTNGGSIALGSSQFTYVPPPAYVGLDAFSYSVTNGHGCSATGEVVVTITSTNSASGNKVVSITAAGNGWLLLFSGIPGRQYVLQSAAAVTGPWTDLSGAVAANSVGLIQFTDSTTPEPSTRFYRIRAATGSGSP